MLTHFGWKAMLGIVIATLGYYIYFRRELRALRGGALVHEPEVGAQLPIPLWVTVGHLLFMFTTVAINRISAPGIVMRISEWVATMNCVLPAVSRSARIASSASCRCGDKAAST